MPPNSTISWSAGSYASAWYDREGGWTEGNRRCQVPLPAEAGGAAASNAPARNTATAAVDRFLNRSRMVSFDGSGVGRVPAVRGSGARSLG